ncbi:TRAP transporter large permease [Antarcticimicrobium luteum]|uniref:TRAP transporter large permease protein n=1 Tax=Antarcticimicrobium luteum TaxID=2547397 RepID=A0A4V3ARV6_9RHOB|nr:TRAP transporter large permease [Antarcticimicrobium luteum]TDK48127.1 TRAP transporter large permease [Antarcticimicrobium luteum]
MTGIVAGAIAFLFALLLNGAPVAFAMLIAGAAGLYLTGGYYPLVGILKTGPYEHVASYTLTTLPMFILMAEFLTAGRFTRDLFAASDKWLGHLRGGIAYSAIAGGVLLAAISGSSSAAAGTLSAAAYPEMKRFGYDTRFSTAVLAVVGTLAIMVPPSIGLVFYGIITETSVGKLLVAGFLPGAVTAIGYALSINFQIRRRPEIAPRSAARAPRADRLESLRSVWPVLGLMLLIIVSIYSGVITPTEIGAVGALMALALAILMGRVGPRQIGNALANATRNSAMILSIIACAAVFGAFITLTGVTQELLLAIQSSGVNRYLVLCAVLLLLFVLGFFLDQIAILVLTMPLVFPLLAGLDFDPVWLGIIFVKTAEIGLITPPMGLNVFIVSSTTDVPARLVFKGIWPFVATEFMVLGLLIAVPAISLWLPALAGF